MAISISSCDARGTVVGAQERELVAVRVDLLVGVRPGIVVGADHDPLEAISGCHEPIRLTIDSRSPVTGAAAWNGCSRTLPPSLREVLGDHLALAGVGLRAGGPRADLADLLEVSEGTLAVDRGRGGEHGGVGLRGFEPLQERDVKPPAKPTISRGKTTYLTTAFAVVAIDRSDAVPCDHSLSTCLAMTLVVDVLYRREFRRDDSAQDVNAG